MYSVVGGMKDIVETKSWTFWGHDLKGHMPSNNTVVYSLEYVWWCVVCIVHLWSCQHGSQTPAQTWADWWEWSSTTPPTTATDQCRLHSPQHLQIYSAMHNFHTYWLISTTYQTLIMLETAAVGCEHCRHDHHHLNNHCKQRLVWCGDWLILIICSQSFHISIHYNYLECAWLWMLSLFVAIKPGWLLFTRVSGLI